MTDYDLLLRQLDALLCDIDDRLALSANFTALLFAEMTDVNWLGLYIRRGDKLVLGPFQGLPACVHIPIGTGVCGTAAAQRKTLRVGDVHLFDGHISCDPASRSELVVPLQSDGRLLGVLDIDSPSRERFTQADQDGVEALCKRFLFALERSGIPDEEFI
jgi:GAF domain-containing protein